MTGSVRHTEPSTPASAVACLPPTNLSSDVHMGKVEVWITQPCRFGDRREMDPRGITTTRTVPLSRGLSRPRVAKPANHPAHHMLHDLTQHLLVQPELVDTIAVHDTHQPVQG
jgi:hypothetical protein